MYYNNHQITNIPPQPSSKPGNPLPTSGSSTASYMIPPPHQASFQPNPSGQEYDQSASMQNPIGMFPGANPIQSNKNNTIDIIYI